MTGVKWWSDLDKHKYEIKSLGRFRNPIKKNFDNRYGLANFILELEPLLLLFHFVYFYLLIGEFIS